MKVTGNTASVSESYSDLIGGIYCTRVLILKKLIVAGPIANKPGKTFVELNIDLTDI